MKISHFCFQKWKEAILLVGLILAFAAPSFSQRPMKNDYIVVADSAMSQGRIQDLPAEGNTVIYFTRSKKKDFERFTIVDISEFRVSERVFFRKEILDGGEKKFVFLEKLPNSIPHAIFWRLNEDVASYYLETPDGIAILAEWYPGQLREAIDNPLLDRLLELTKLNDYALVYLSRTANTIQKPRTFSRYFALTPYVGYSSQTVQFSIPDSREIGQVTASSPAVGLNGEAFFTFKRNLSLNGGMTWTLFDGQDFFRYEYNLKQYESDVYLDFNLVQIPITAKYYLDLKPNKWRLFGEMGYSYAIPIYNNLGAFQAEIEGNSIVTSNKTFEMSDHFSGFSWGLGVEKILDMHHGLVFGLRQFKLLGEESEFVQGLNFQLGFKF